MRKLTFDENEVSALMQIIEFWNDHHRTGPNVGDKIYKFFGYKVDLLGKRDRHWVALKKKKGDFAMSYPYKSTNGTVCSDHKTLAEAKKSADESNRSEGLSELYKH